jgi:DDE family transposase
MTDCSPRIAFDFHPRLPIVTICDAPESSSDGGVLLLRALDERLGLTAGFAERVPDWRDPRFVQHPRLEQLRQRVYQIALGYEDCNDATRLRNDRAFKVACDRLPEDEAGLSSQPTLSRMENAVPMSRVKALLLQVENGFVRSLSRRRKLVVLDIDPTDDPTHGAQQLTFFHGYYDTYMYFPLLVFDGETGDLASVVLRPGNVGGARGAKGLIERLVRAVRLRCPRAMILVRADSAFATPEFLAKLDELHDELGEVRYVVGVGKHKGLIELLRPWMVIAQAWYEHTGEPARRFRSFQHKAGKWSHARRVIGKAEHLPDGANPRFVVTNLTEDDEQVYLTYCGRGQAENYIKAFKNAVRGDRLSCSSFAANFLRVLVHALAYRLLHALRAQVQPMNQPQMQLDTLRIRLLKVAAIITQSARRILVRLPMCFPAREMFMDAALRLSCPAPS